MGMKLVRQLGVHPNDDDHVLLVNHSFVLEAKSHSGYKFQLSERLVQKGVQNE